MHSARSNPEISILYITGLGGGGSTSCRQVMKPPNSSDAWRVLLIGGLLGRFLGYEDVARLGRLSRLGREGWREAWWQCTLVKKPFQLRKMLRLAVEAAKVEHIEIMLRGDVGRDTLMREESVCWTEHVDSFLPLAARNGHLEVVQKLIEVGKRELVMLTKNNGISALHVAAEMGHLEVVRALIEVGGRELVMLTNDNVQSALHYAAAEGHLDIVRALLEVGGQKLLMLKNCMGMTALYKAVNRLHVDVIRALLEFCLWEDKKRLVMTTNFSSRMSSLFLAAQQGHEQVVRMLLDVGGADLSKLVTICGRSALWIAAFGGHVEACRALLKVGGRELALMKNNHGDSALYAAALRGDLDLARALIKVGGRELVMLTNNRAQSALHIAARWGKLEVVQELINVGGRELVVLKDNAHESALDLARFHEKGAYVEVIPVLEGEMCATRKSKRKRV